MVTALGRVTPNRLIFGIKKRRFFFATHAHLDFSDRCRVRLGAGALKFVPNFLNGNLAPLKRDYSNMLPNIVAIFLVPIAKVFLGPNF